ncbi:MAG: hypothetical protein K0S22_404 [Oscillospiraceae bacterium]|jgi:hypothetical protein|nr:hypothetical protein [Oscillospiraceae bacterium]
MAARDISALLAELSARELLFGATELQARSVAEQARLQLAAYCNLSESAPLPDGMFYGWLTLTGALLSLRTDASAGRVSSISEGDRTVTFSKEDEGLPPACKAVADRYRRLS